MQQTFKQINTALELEYGHPVIIVPGTRNVVFVVPGELEAYKLAFHLLTAGTPCSLAHGFEANAWHVTCPDYLEPPASEGWEVGDAVEWTAAHDGHKRILQGDVTAIGEDTATCVGRCLATGNVYNDAVPYTDLRRWKPRPEWE